MTRPRARTSAILATALLVASGCGGDDSGNDGGSTDGGGGTTTQQESPGDEGANGDEGTNGTDGADDSPTMGVAGENVFADNCQACHGNMGAGGHVGPNLQTSDVTDDPERVEQIVREGRGRMPAFGQTLSDEEIDAVVEYVSQELAPRG